MLQMIKDRYLVKKRGGEEKEREEVPIIMASAVGKEMQGHDSWLPTDKTLIGPLKVNF